MEKDLIGAKRWSSKIGEKNKCINTVYNFIIKNFQLIFIKMNKFKLSL